MASDLKLDWESMGYPPHFANPPSGIERAVCEDIARRQALGIAKYGQTVADNPLVLRAWLQHAYEETLDKAVYLKRAIAEIDRTSKGAARFAEVNGQPGGPSLYPGDPGYDTAKYELSFLKFTPLRQV